MSGRKPLEISPVQRRQIADSIAVGASIADVAEVLGVSDRTLYRAAKRDDELRRTLSDAISEREANRERVGHGHLGRYNKGCRCGICREAHRQAKAKWRARKYAEPIPDHIPHGRPSTYNQWGCRCDPCRKAHQEYNRPYEAAYQRRKRQARSDLSVVPDVPPVSEPLAAGAVHHREHNQP